MPVEWFLSRLCEEFHCLPSEALKEWEHAPCGLLETIIKMRAFAVTKAMCDRAKKAEDRPDTPLAHLLTEIEFEFAEEEMQRVTQQIADAE